MIGEILDRPHRLRPLAVVDAALERYFLRFALILLVLLLATSIARDLKDKMWVDELFTLHIARQANIVEAISEGCDNAPPLYAMLVRAILPLGGSEALAVRLPATLGYCGMVLCLVLFCRRRMSAVYSFATTLLACNALLPYSTMGRGYGILLGGAAGALLCWQSAAEGRRRGLSLIALAVCLALMIATHYYAVFFLVPLLLGEIVRARAARRPDLAVLAALVPSLLVLGVHFPLIAGAKAFQEHFWSPADLRGIGRLYEHPFTVLFLSVYLLGVALSRALPRLSWAGRAHEARIPAYEWVALGTLTLMPPIVLIASAFTTHIFVERYVPWSVIGFAVLTGALLSKAVRGDASVGVSVVGILVVLLAGREIAYLNGASTLHEGESVSRQLTTLPDGDQPIVVPNAHVFMELSYYAVPRLRERLVYPASRDLDLHYRGYDTDPLILVPLSHRAKLHVEACDAVLAQYPRFIVAAVSADYLPDYLTARGYRVTPIGPPSAESALLEAQAPRDR